MFSYRPKNLQKQRMSKQKEKGSYHEKDLDFSYFSEEIIFFFKILEEEYETET